MQFQKCVVIKKRIVSKLHKLIARQLQNHNIFTAALLPPSTLPLLSLSFAGLAIEPPHHTHTHTPFKLLKAAQTQRHNLYKADLTSDLHTHASTMQKLENSCGCANCVLHIRGEEKMVASALLF